VAEVGKICAYCGRPVLTGDEKPEHAIPAALGSSLTVYTVCDPCNERVGKEVDQPFLEDEWVRVHRSESGVIDPRRGRKDRPVRSPLLEGYTDHRTPCPQVQKRRLQRHRQTRKKVKPSES
jgi:HNH endonuclease